MSSKYIQSMSINAGHIGLAVSSKAHNQLWPDAAMWIADHSTTIVWAVGAKLQAAVARGFWGYVIGVGRGYWLGECE